MRGAATEIFHEGIRILGLKIVEDGRVRRQTPLEALDRYTQEVARETVAST